MASKLPSIFTYLTEEEKQAFDILSALENRSGSNMARVIMVKYLKERGLLKEELTERGDLIQTVVKRDGTGE